MNVPTFTTPTDAYHQELNQNMQTNLSDEGYVVPSLTTAAITQAALTMPDGTIWYDNQTFQIKAKLNGVVTPL